MDNNAIQENNESRAKERHFTYKVTVTVMLVGIFYDRCRKAKGRTFTFHEKWKEALSLFTSTYIGRKVKGRTFTLRMKVS